MKRLLPFFLIMMMISLFSCKKAKTVVVNVDTSKADLDALSADISKIDIDMTKMSVTMIYSQIFNMLIMPEEYENKTIKVSGAFEVYPNENGEIDCFTLTVMDATACCKEGLDFIWLGDHTYPDDYPEVGDEITITGKYKTFENEDGITRSYLYVSELIPIEDRK